MHSANTLAKILISKHITANSICIDATAGNGNDTYYLASKAKYVYAFDIQAQSEENTKMRLKNFSNFQFILASHHLINRFVHQNIDVAMFNLGYLPYSDESITTIAQTSIQAIDQCYQLLNSNGIITICCYHMHIGGREETNAVINHVITNYNNYQILQSKESGPILIVIRK